MKKLLLTAIVATILTGCGGGGSGETGGVTPSPAKPYSTFLMNGRVAPFAPGVLTSSDGSEHLMLTTIDEGNPFNVTPPTPVYVLKGEIDGSVTNLTNSLFDKIPEFYWVRNVNTFTYPATGTQAIWFCNHGREVGHYKTAPIPRVNGVWGEQDALYVMENGKFVDKSHTLPQIVDQSHGCAVAKNGDGSVSLVKRIIGGNTNSQSDKLILNYINNAWVEVFGSSWDYPGIFRGIEQVFFAVAGNFQRAVFGDNIVFGNHVLTKINGSYAVHSSLDAPDLISQGYTMIQGSTSGDLNNDGWDDLILVYSADGIKLKPYLSGSKLAIFMNDGSGNLVYQPNAIIEYYDDTQFGLDIKIMDINFDGKNDIVTHGSRYMLGTNLYWQKTDKVLINNGLGKFNVKAIDGTKLNSKCTENCQIATWFLKGKDSNSYTLMTYSKSWDVRTFYSQLVTKESPLAFK